MQFIEKEIILFFFPPTKTVKLDKVKKKNTKPPKLLETLLKETHRKCVVQMERLGS